MKPQKSNSILLELFPSSDYKNKSDKAEIVDFEIPESIVGDDPIDTFNFPIRTANALKKHGIETVDQLINFPETKLLKIPMIGVKTLRAVILIKEKIKSDCVIEKPETDESEVVIEQPNYYEHIEIESLGLPTKAVNAIKKAGVLTVGQLIRVSEGMLLQHSNIGVRTIKLICDIKQSINQGRKIDGPNLEVTASDYLTLKPQEKIQLPPEKLIDTLMQKCGDSRSMDIVIRRYGLFSGEKQTLEEIGEDYKVTRERVRQIQVKSLKFIKYRSASVKRQLCDLVDNALFENSGLITDDEADRIIPEILKNTDYDGSSVLDLMCEFGWCQTHSIGDIKKYSPLLNGLKLENITNQILKVVSEKETGVYLNEMIQNLPILNSVIDERFSKALFILKYCRIDPRIEESNPDLIISKNLSEADLSELRFKRFYEQSQVTKKWISAITEVLKEAGEPLHFTEITNNVNDRLFVNDRKLDVRHTHNLLISTPIFAHSGVRGTWGLTEWGISKLTTTELVEECIRKAGFPLHWKQIFNYVSKYKDTKPINITAILNSKSEFERKRRGVYGFRDVKKYRKIYSLDQI